MDDGISKLGLLHGRNAGQERIERALRQMAEGAGGTKDPEAARKELMEACRGFETIFLAKLWQQMRSTLPKDGSLQGSQSEFYLSMFDHEVAATLARGEGAGIARMMFEQLSRRLDAADPKTSPAGSLGGYRPELPRLLWPLEGEISSGFGWREDPFTGARAWHAGIDLVAEHGSPVRSCWPGEVSFAGAREGYGETVIIEHPGGWTSLYAHNSRNLVEVGQKIRAGEVIAHVGSSGRATGPHLHFELRRKDGALNPLKVLRQLGDDSFIGRNV
jgi:peptidoglycan hydrolase FlgJ